MPSGAFNWVVMLCAAGRCWSPSAPGVPTGAGDPVHTAGVVPGTVDACCGDEHALTSATQAAAESAETATTSRCLGIAEAYPGGAQFWSGPNVSPSPER